MRSAQASHSRAGMALRTVRPDIRRWVGTERKDKPMNARTLLRSALDGMVAARERQARHYARAHLLALDDGTLARAGLTRADVRRGDIAAR